MVLGSCNVSSIRATAVELISNVLSKNYFFQKEDVTALAGYLSLHQTTEALVIMWTPNQLMNRCCEEGEVEEDRRYLSVIRTVVIVTMLSCMFTYISNSVTVVKSSILV